MCDSERKPPRGIERLLVGMGIRYYESKAATRWDMEYGIWVREVIVGGFGDRWEVELRGGGNGL